jgi:hypothetical protein
VSETEGVSDEDDEDRGTVGGSPAELWEKLERSADQFRVASEPTTKPKTDAERQIDKETKKKRRRTIRRRLDAIGFLTWTYIFLKLFIVDVDRKALEAISKDAGKLIDYRAFAYLAILIIIVIWLKKSWIYLLYVSFFPLIFIAWRVPNAIARRKSWLLVVGVVHVMSTIVTSLRFNIVTKGLAVFALVGATIPHNPFVVVPSSTYLFGLLAVTYYRSVRNSFSKSRFLDQQDRLIKLVIDKNPFKLDIVTAELQSSQLELYPKAEIDKFTTALNTRVAINRGLFFWAYQLDQYRQTPVSLSMNAIAYVGLFFGTAITVSAINLGIYHVDPQQFAASPPPSVLRMALFSASSLAFNAGAGIEASGDAAVSVRLFSGVLGVLFMATLIVNVALSYRRDRDDLAIKKTVKDLRKNAFEQEKDLKRLLNVDIEEALNMLDQLGANIMRLMAKVLSTIPDDFLRDDPPDERSA